MGYKIAKCVEFVPPFESITNAQIALVVREGQDRLTIRYWNSVVIPRVF